LTQERLKIAPIFVLRCKFEEP